MDSIRRTMLNTGAAATVLAAAPGMLAQQAGQAATSFYENGQSAFILCGAPNTFLPDTVERELPTDSISVSRRHTYER